jgi:hypothetical protein
MAAKACAVVAALSAASTVIGCVAEELGPPAIAAAPYPALATSELATVGAPGPQDQPFGEALAGFAHEVNRLHAFKGAQADAAIAWSTLQLATILERMPAAAAEPRLRRAAEAIRKNEAGLESATAAPEAPPAERLRQSLAIAATALLQLARSHYGDTPEIAAEARVFAAAVESIDVEREPADRAAIVNALVRATHVLGRMYAINVAPASGPRP